MGTRPAPRTALAPQPRWPAPADQSPPPSGSGDARTGRPARQITTSRNRSGSSRASGIGMPREAGIDRVFRGGLRGQNRICLGQPRNRPVRWQMLYPPTPVCCVSLTLTPSPRMPVLVLVLVRWDAEVSWQSISIREMSHRRRQFLRHATTHIDIIIAPSPSAPLRGVPILCRPASIARAGDFSHAVRQCLHD